MTNNRRSDSISIVTLIIHSIILKTNKAMETTDIELEKSIELEALQVSSLSIFNYRSDSTYDDNRATRIDLKPDWLSNGEHLTLKPSRGWPCSFGMVLL